MNLMASHDAPENHCKCKQLKEEEENKGYTEILHSMHFQQQMD